MYNYFIISSQPHFGRSTEVISAKYVLEENMSSAQSMLKVMMKGANIVDKSTIITHRVYIKVTA